LKLSIFGHCSIVFELTKKNYNSALKAFKATKITQIGVEMSKICSFE
jgi:hypothetical protein